MIDKITPSVDLNQWLKRLETQFNEPTNQNSIKFVEPTNNKTSSKKLGTSIINSPISLSEINVFLTNYKSKLMHLLNN